MLTEYSQQQLAEYGYSSLEETHRFIFSQENIQDFKFLIKMKQLESLRIKEMIVSHNEIETFKKLKLKKININYCYIEDVEGFSFIDEIVISRSIFHLKQLEVENISVHKSFIIDNGLEILKCEDTLENCNEYSELNQKFNQSGDVKALFLPRYFLSLWDTSNQTYEEVTVTYHEILSEFEKGNHDPKAIADIYRGASKERLKSITMDNYASLPDPWDSKDHIFMTSPKESFRRIHESPLGPDFQKALSHYVSDQANVMVRHYDDEFIDRVGKAFKQEIPEWIRDVMKACAGTWGPNNLRVMFQVAYFGSRDDKRSPISKDAWYELTFHGDVMREQSGCFCIGQDQDRNFLVVKMNSTENYCPIYICDEEDFSMNPNPTGLRLMAFESFDELLWAVSRFHIGDLKLKRMPY